MEAVPRLHMLWFALKSSPEGTSFANLKKYIAEFYQEDPESYSKEVFALETLRNQAMHTTKDGCSVMKRYYCQLHSLQNRFPQLSERGIFTFTWKDLYQSNVSEVTDMRHELAAVLFNIAASHTQVGASVTRGDVDGMKMACTHFQCAAWAFGELRERYANVNSGSDFMTIELLVFMQQVSYAQAQECILEKSLIDNRKPNIVSKVTSQIVGYYGAALAALLTGGDDGPIAQVIDSSVYKLWKKYVRFKINYLNCILYLYQGQHAEEQRKMGERVTLYQAAWEKLEDARKESKGLPDQKEINESLIFTADVVEAKRKNAKNENEFIYHEAIPELSSISAVQGANLVNGISFSVTDPEVAGVDIFARLVPMKAHEASSLYSEEKAKLLRKYGAQIDDKDAELTGYMSSLTLEHLNINEEKANKLPQGIVDRCAALNANKTAIPDLIAAMSQLADITADVELNLKELASMLRAEEQDEREFQTTTGVQRTPNPHITELTREYQKYNEAHTRAGESNNTLRKAMSLHVNNLKILARPLNEIQQLMPKLSSELNTAEIFKDVKLIVNKVNEMKAQRAQFHADLRIAVNEDDITAKVIAHGSDERLQQLFERELAKHERLTQLIEQNLLAQSNILQALTESYAKAAPVLKTLADVKQKRENFFSSLAASYDVYEDLLGKSAKGLEFYKKLAGNVQKLLTRFKSARDVQSEERQQRLKSVYNNSQQLSKETAKLSPTPTATNLPTTTNSTPKLRDYLKAKQANINTNSAVVMNDPSGINSFVASNTQSSSVYVPPIRPVPLGSENPTQAICSSNSAYYSSSSPAPNEPPPPYSLQQQQYYDPGAAGYTNPMYQQQQQNIAPPEYKLQASPNSQFSNLNTNMANLSIQQQQQQQYSQTQTQNSYANAFATTNQSYQSQYGNSQVTNLATSATNAALSYGASNINVGGGNMANSSVAQGYDFANPATFNYQQQQPNYSDQSINQYMQAINNQQAISATAATSAAIPTTQPLYIATANQNDITGVSVPASFQAPYVVNQVQQQQQDQQQQQTMQHHQQQQHQTLQLQQQLTLQLQQQQALQLQQQSLQLQQQQQQIEQQQQLNSTQQQQQQQQAPQQVQYQQQQPQITATPPPKAATTTADGTYGVPFISASNHPGYSFNPQSGTYEYGSGYQSANATNTPAYGQYTTGNNITHASVVGTTDSEGANKINLATGFDSPIVSHTKATAQAAASAAATSTEMYATKDEAVPNYYTQQYAYHAHEPLNYTAIAQPIYDQQQQQSHQQQPSQQQPQQQQQQSKSVYIQSGGTTIANTQTTTSSTGYASTSAQQHSSAPPEQQQPTIAAVVNQPMQTIKKSSNIDLLTDIDFTGAGLNVPPPILPAPALQPQVVGTSSPPASLVGTSTPNQPLELQRTIEPQPTPPPPPQQLQLENMDPPSITSPQMATSPHSLQLSSPICSPAARKPSLDNLSNCSDLSSLDNFDWDSVSMHSATTERQQHSTIAAATTNSATFQMKAFDPFSNDDKTLKYFHKEVERYEKTIESLNVKMLNGNTQLTAKWKELQDLLAKDTNKRTTTIAKLFPEKNRSLDCLPYDHARVKLDKNTDDYINAAYIKNLGNGSPNFIIAQTPQQNTLTDFWSMIWSQKSRTVVSLHTENEMLDPYWPQQLNKEMHHDDFSVKCVKINHLTHTTEYMLKLAMHGSDPILDLSVLQIKQWTKSLPTQVIGIARNALQTHQQRCLEFNAPASPLIMNCLTGSERSELVAIAICCILATQTKRPVLINVVDVWSRICAQRQNSLRDTAALEQSMQIVLNHAHDVLNKRGIMTSYQMKIAPQVASKEKEDIKDPLNELDPLWKMK